MIESWHVTFAAVGRTDVFAKPPTVHRSLRVILRRIGESLLFFYLGGDHGHLNIAGARASVAKRVRYTLSALGQALGVDLHEPTFTRVAGRSHMTDLVPYILSQARHHGFAQDDALWTGSSFPFILDAAHSPFAAAPTLDVLRQLGRPRYYDALTLSPFRLEPATADSIRRAGPHRIVEAACRATLTQPKLRGGDSLSVATRVAAATLFAEAGLGSDVVADHLDIPTSTARRLLTTTPDPAIITAVANRIALEDEVARQRARQHRTGVARPPADEPRRGAHFR